VFSRSPPKRRDRENIFTPYAKYTQMSDDKVTCLICGHQSVSLARHFKAVHGISADAYKSKYPEGKVRSDSCQASRSQAIKEARIKYPMKGRTKVTTCPVCQKDYNIAWSFSHSDLTCPECKAKNKKTLEDQYFASKVELEDYVTCIKCSYRAENLTSHLQNAHPELIGCYPGQVMAFNSATRDKTHLRGKTLSAETKAKMSANAARWNKGRTKETDERLARAAAKQSNTAKNNPLGGSWSKGLTKETHPSLKLSGEKMKATKAAQGYKPSCRRVTLTAEDLAPFTTGNGKVAIAKASSALGYSFPTLSRECARLGLPVSRRLISQVVCLENVSKALGGAEYSQEWSSKKFLNPRTGWRFKFDGYFPEYSLLVEFHGPQHWKHIRWYNQRDQDFQRLLERDCIKESLVRADPKLRYLVVRSDEDFRSIEYLRGRLVQEGLLKPA
jgi:hypothetical protein